MLPTVADVIARFLEHRQLECRAGLIVRASLLRSEYLLGRFALHFGQLTIDRCRRQDLTRFLLLHPQWQSPHMKLDAVAQVVLCFRWAADPDEGGIIDRCPYRRPRNMEQPEPRPPVGKADFWAIMRAAQRRPAKASGRTVTPKELRAHRAYAWAIGENPALGLIAVAKKKRGRGRPPAVARQIFDWLKRRPEWRDKLPPTFVTFRRALDHVRQFVRETGRCPEPLGRRVGGFGYQASRRGFRVAMLFLWRTGCRTCEMRAAQVEDLDGAAGVVRLRRHKTSRTSGAARVIAVDGHALRMLRIYLAGRTTGPIFLNGRGRAWTTQIFADMFRRYADLAGVGAELSPYGLRHGFVSRALENGVGERQVADVTGHKSTRYIEWYSRSLRSKTDYLHGVLDQIHRKRPSA